MTPRVKLWTNDDASAWRDALARYDEVVAAQNVKVLAERDRWYREELPSLIHGRKEPHVTVAELALATEWKMARGVWRAPNLLRVKGNDPALVISTSASALAQIPHATKPIVALAELDGVGPATASSIAAAAAPEHYPFFDELVAEQIPALGAVAWTMSYYTKYADAIRARALALGHKFTPADVAQALWSNSGGKAKYVQ